MSRGDGSLYQQNNSANYWMQFFLNGRKHRESTGESDEKKARDVLRKRLKEVHASEVTGLVFESVRMRKVTVSDLCDALESDLTLRRKWSAQNRSHLKRVRDEAPKLRLGRQPTQPFKFFIYSNRTGRRFERWAARPHRAWPFTNTCKHIP